MPTRFSSFNFKSQGPTFLKNNVEFAYVCKGLLKSDSFVTLQSKSIAKVPVVNADVSITASGQDCLTTINAKSGIDPTGTALATDDICVVYCSDTLSEAILAVDATDRIITNETGDTIDIPAAQHYSRETTAV